MPSNSKFAYLHFIHLFSAICPGVSMLLILRMHRFG